MWMPAVAGSARRLRATSMPFMSAIEMSSRTRSTALSRAMVKASVPVPAVLTL